MTPLNTGAYSIQEAARYTGIPSQDISRWLFGEHRLWDSQLAELSSKALGFRDLIELRIVHAFRQKGLSLQSIRHILCYLREVHADRAYPLSNRRLCTDGRRIFIEAISKTKQDDEPLTDIMKRQLVIEEVIRPSLHKGVIYDDTDQLAIRWYPASNHNKLIVLDPLHAFGKPIIEGTGIKTAILYQAYLAEQDAQLVARLYTVPLRAVSAAIQYEQNLDNRVAA